MADSPIQELRTAQMMSDDPQDAATAGPPPADATEPILPAEPIRPGPPIPQPGANTPADETLILRREDQAPTFAWLAVVMGPQAGRLYKLKRHGTRIGRKAGNDIVIDDRYVSAEHALVEAKDEVDGGTQFIIRDLGSANGTRINGQPEDMSALRDGDRISFGETELEFKQL